MIWNLIPFAIAFVFAWPVIALGNLYDAAKAAERAGRRTLPSPAVVYAAPVRTRSITRPEVDAARQQFADAIVAERHRTRRTRTALKAAGYVALAALAGTTSMAMADGYHWSRWAAYTVSILLTVACLVVGLVFVKGRAARG